MEDPRWLRLITVGLILGSLVLGYSIVTGSFVKSKPRNSQFSDQVIVKSPMPSNRSAMVNNPSSSPTTAYNMLVQRNQNQVKVLPKTGYPLWGGIVLSILGMVAGWKLRKFSQ